MSVTVSRQLLFSENQNAKYVTCNLVIKLANISNELYIIY